MGLKRSTAPLLLTLLAALCACRPDEGDAALRCLAYAETFNEVNLVLRVEEAAYPILLEKLTLAQNQLRERLEELPRELLLAARRVVPDWPEARAVLEAEGRRADELRAALLLEAEELLDEPPRPRPVDGQYRVDLLTVALVTPQQRLEMLRSVGLTAELAAQLEEYEIERRTAGLAWHELAGRYRSALAARVPEAAAYRRVNRELTSRLEAVREYRRGLSELENPFEEAGESD